MFVQLAYRDRIYLSWHPDNTDSVYPDSCLVGFRDFDAEERHAEPTVSHVKLVKLLVCI